MNRKNLLFYSCLLIFVFLNISNAFAFFNISYKCQNNKCVSGEIMDWIITVNNFGEDRIDIVGIQIRNNIDNNVTAFYNTTYTPLTDKKDEIFSVAINQRKTKIIQSKIPHANNGANFIYYPCFINAVNEQIYAKEDVYTIEYCYKDRVGTVLILECISNLSCNTDEYCQNNSCLNLFCYKCGYAAHHKCLSYECCESSACDDDQECMNNSCTILNCTNEEGFFNHACVSLDCPYNQKAVNHSCIKLNCGEDESYFNHSCVRLRCVQYEIISNHSCISLNCSEDEFIYNSSCKKLDCKYNEAVSGHSCQLLACSFFQKIDQHRCINDTKKAFRLILELSVIIIIIVLLATDVRHLIFRRKRGKKSILKKASVEKEGNPAEEKANEK